MDMDLLQQSLQRGDIGLAARICDAALEHDSDDAFALYWKGQLFRMSGDSKQSVQWLSQAFALAKQQNDSDTLGAFGLAYGISLQETGNLREAAEVFSFAAERSSEYEATLCNSLGITFRRLGYETEALAAYERGFKAELQQALLLMRSEGKWGLETSNGKQRFWMDEDVPEAIHALLTEGKRAGIILANVATILLERGETERAVTCLVRCIILGDPDKRAASCLSRLGRQITKQDAEAAANRDTEIIMDMALRIALSSDS